MKAGDGLRALALVLALAPAAYAVEGGQSQQPEQPPRRPQGPAAGPVIKLPPGAGATEERAQTPAAKEVAPTKWEYCYIKGFAYRQTGFSSSSPRVTVVYVYRLPGGAEEVEGSGEEEALGNALVKLGEDGWELTAIRTDLELRDGNGKTASVYYFKRPKRQE